MCIATKGKQMMPLSAQDVCDGGQIDTPWDYIKEDGAVTGGQCKGSGPFGKDLCSDLPAALPPPRPAGQRPVPGRGPAWLPARGVSPLPCGVRCRLRQRARRLLE
mmetsp:Transcript_126111/g.403547  ORF Transcript_126111/g.403547 Transcript_126111/m.403547 type:complete len:105 (-) Transcript_126111:1141-1455(-)